MLGPCRCTYRVSRERDYGRAPFWPGSQHPRRYRPPIILRIIAAGLAGMFGLSFVSLLQVR